MLKARLAGAKGAIALEERLARLDQAVFGIEVAGQSDDDARAE